MKKQTLQLRSISALLAVAIFLSGCASTTMIQSNPDGAKVYLNGEPVGNTPYMHRDTKIVGSTTVVKLEKDGYTPLLTSLSRNEEVDAGAIVGGIFLLVPFLWTMKYKASHTYELTAVSGYEQVKISSQTQSQSKSKADKLRELKELLDEKVINQEEYEKEKKKILAEEEN